MAVKTGRSLPTANVVTKLLELDAGTVNALVSLNVHNPSTQSDEIVTIWISPMDSVTGSTPLPDADLIDTITLGVGETVVRTCAHLSPDEKVWVMSANGDAVFRASALYDTGV